MKKKILPLPLILPLQIYLLLLLLLLVAPVALLPGCGTYASANTNVNTNADTVATGGELIVASFYDSQFLHAAARKYEETYEGAKVNITIYEGEDKDTFKYSQVINTALMSGLGEDIIDVSRVPWWKLADKNKLLGLDGKINIAPEAYYKNIMDAYIYKGNRYVVPLCFSFEAFSFNGAYADEEPTRHITIETLLKLADKYPGTPLFNDSGFGMGRMTLAYKLFEMSFGDFVDIENKSANVDGDQFISLLKNVQSISGSLAPPNIGQTPLIRQLVLYSPAMSHVGTVDYENVFLLTDVAGSAGQSLFLASSFLPAVNANSNNTKLAIDFIRFLISDEIQSSPELLYCPVNRKAAQTSAELVFKELELGGYVPDGFGSGSLARNATKFDELAERLSSYELAYADVFIRDFVMAEMRRFFQGEVSAEQAAKSLQSRLNTYLNE
ncbi:MAG: ABC transporter substrate-binding protein [Oscillospiraceae bacterium]|nr:ABC transporter substrate-binding protein [Oscillospiraceae bacterium]